MKSLINNDLDSNSSDYESDESANESGDKSDNKSGDEKNV